jgi:cyclopropane-fatty-acyl-phospholipid synthase
MGVGIAWAERGLVPEWVERRAIRGLCARRLREASRPGSREKFLERLAGSPIAELPQAANKQHYEVPSEFFALVLGAQRKYSSAIWPDGVDSLDAAEEAMLALTCERAGIRDGEEILELGCGWGSLSLYMARRFPAARITAVSNSATQRAYIESQGLGNLRVVTADMNDFDAGRQFHRIVSVEMFEHMRDWNRLLQRLAGWLREDGRLFIHVFCHTTHPYTFDGKGDASWMGRHFFSGGIMPSRDLPRRVAPPSLELEKEWWINGTHYQRTAAAWSRNLAARRSEVSQVLAAHYGRESGLWYHRWRLFFLACEELFGYAGGREWGVGHYLLCRTTSPGGDTKR